MPRKLEDIDVEEISLVRSAANRRQFLILKSEEETMEKWLKILKSFLGAEEEESEYELEETDIAKAKELPESAIKAIAGALNILNKYKDVFPPDVTNAMKTLAKYAAYAYPAKKAEMTDEEFVAEVVEKAGSKFSKATLEQLKLIKEAIDKLLDSKWTLSKKKYGDISDELRLQLEELERMKKAEADRLQKEKEAAELKKTEEFEELKKRLDKLEKKKPTSKQIKEKEDGDPEEEIKKKAIPEWPSLTGQAEEALEEE